MVNYRIFVNQQYFAGGSHGLPTPPLFPNMDRIMHLCRFLILSTLYIVINGHMCAYLLGKAVLRSGVLKEDIIPLYD